MAGLTNSRFALAVHALTLLADCAPSRMSSDEMSGSTRANPVHLRRVLGRLREAGLVESRSGPNGGWSLAADPDTTTLDKIWVALNEDEPLLGLRGVNPDCRVGQTVQTALIDVDRRVRDEVERQLAETTIADLKGLVPA